MFGTVRVKGRVFEALEKHREKRGMSAHGLVVEILTIWAESQAVGTSFRDDLEAADYVRRGVGYDDASTRRTDYHG